MNKIVLSIRQMRPGEKIKGKVWIGDPCYVFSDPAWDEYCDMMGRTHEH
jgi:hypothetical protein